MASSEDPCGQEGLFDSPYELVCLLDEMLGVFRQGQWPEACEYQRILHLLPVINEATAQARATRTGLDPLMMEAQNKLADAVREIINHLNSWVDNPRRASEFYFLVAAFRTTPSACEHQRLPIITRIKETVENEFACYAGKPGQLMRDEHFDYMLGLAAEYGITAATRLYMAEYLKRLRSLTRRNGGEPLEGEALETVEAQISAIEHVLAAGPRRPFSEAAA